jgi:DNA-binding LytR/AlgR family response regulator
MSKLKVAVLEDEAEKLKELVGMLRATDLVEVVAHARERESFMAAVAAKGPEALVLDIDLVGEPEGGLRVAEALALPVLFISGHVARHTAAIEVLDTHRVRLPIAHLSKPLGQDKLKNRLLKFCDEVRAMRTRRRIELRVNGKGDVIEVSIDSIVAITVDERGAASNNKCVLFIDREPVVIADVTLARLEEYGFPKTDFVQIARDCAINRTHALAWTGSNVMVRCVRRGGELTTETWPVKEAYRR